MMTDHYEDTDTVLRCWSGDWGLPSIDYQSLQLLFLVKLSGCPVKVQKYNNPLFMKLPCLKHSSNDTIISTFSSTLNYLHAQNFNADFNLSNKEKAEIQAYIQLIEEKLVPILHYMWWIDGNNYVEVLRPWFAQVLPVPLNFYYPGAYQRQAQSYFKALYPQLFEDSDDWTSLESMVQRNASECLELLSNRLGEREWFFGRTPCSLDAYVWGILAPMLKVPLPNQTLANNLRGYPNLSNFVVRVLQRYFPPTAAELEASKKKCEEDKEKREKEGDFPHKRLKQVASGLFALVAMVGYAFFAGILQLDVKPEIQEDENYEDTEEYEEFIRGSNE